MIYGYCRISTKGKGQKLDRQLFELMEKVEGLEKQNIFTDEISGLKKSRLGLDALKAKLQKGDVVYVESLSRLSRSTQDLLACLDEFSKHGIEFHSLKENFDFDSLYGKLMLTFLSALVQFERDLIAQRVQEGLEAARQNGKRLGRPSADADKVAKALEMYHNPDRKSSVASICKIVAISKSTFYRELKKIEKQ